MGLATTHRWRAPVEQNATCIAEILLGLEDIDLLEIEDLIEDGVKLPLRVHVECPGERPRCPVCNGMSHSKGSSQVELYDPQSFSRAVKLI
jgi:hypothetical protein